MMINLGNKPVRLLSAVASVGVVLVSAGPAAAATTTPSVSVRETVQVVMDADGAVDTTRMYTQMVAAGNGRVRLEVPTSASGLRDLNGFAKPRILNGKAMWDFDVDGTSQKRTVASYDKPLPIRITPTYRLDGKQMKAKDIVGKSGLLEVRYLIKNLTAESREITYTGVGGKDVTDTGQVVVPLVGSLTIAVPGRFGELEAPDAAVAGNGRGVNNVSWTMVLFEPVGSSVQEVMYQARVKDAVIPAAKLQALVVQPRNTASTRSAQESYKGGAETGVQLTEGATTIDENLLKLQDGAGQLLDGLTQLAAGAEQLNAGLADTAAPGANLLADGAGQLANGTGQLKDGTGQLRAGSGDLADGSGELAAGSGDLAVGAGALSDGIGQLLAGIDALPATLAQDADFKTLKGALTKVQAAIGSKSDPVSPTPSTLNGAINTLQFGLNNPVCDKANPTTTACGFKQVLEILKTQLDNASATAPGAKQGLSQIMDGLDSATGPGAKQALQNLQAVLGCPNNANDGSASAPFVSPTDLCTVIEPALGGPKTTAAVTTKVTLYKVIAGLGSRGTPANTALFGLNTILNKIGSDTTDGTALYALTRLINGIGATSPPSAGTLFYGLEGIRRGLTNPACDLADPTDAANPCGIKEIQGLVSAGIDQVVDGIAATLSDAVSQAYGGSALVADGAEQVADGAGQVADGADLLADGAAQLDDGAGKLDDGAHKVADGAGKLASGLGDAAVGSGKIADGLNKAAPGAKKIQDGAGQLSEEGTKKLVAAGQSTAKDFGTRYATMLALNERGAENALPYGAIDDESAAQSGAFSFELAAANKDGQENTMRGALALAALAIGGLGGTFLYRNRVA